MKNGLSYTYCAQWGSLIIYKCHKCYFLIKVSYPNWFSQTSLWRWLWRMAALARGNLHLSLKLPLMYFRCTFVHRKEGVEIETFSTCLSTPQMPVCLSGPKLCKEEYHGLLGPLLKIWSLKPNYFPLGIQCVQPFRFIHNKYIHMENPLEVFINM